MKITKRKLKLNNRKVLIILTAGIYQLLIFAGLWTAAGSFFKQYIPHHEEQVETEGEDDTKPRDINKEEKILYMGQSGKATGVHLHFEILENGEDVDPEKYFTFPRF